MALPQTCLVYWMKIWSSPEFSWWSSNRLIGNKLKSADGNRQQQNKLAIPVLLGCLGDTLFIQMAHRYNSGRIWRHLMLNLDYSAIVIDVSYSGVSQHKSCIDSCPPTMAILGHYSKRITTPRNRQDVLPPRN